MTSTFEFLEGLYLPGYMTLVNQDYEGRKGYFQISPREPPVTILSSRYLTPRGAHISVSQAGIALVEHLINKGELEIALEDFRDLTNGGRLKKVELNQKFRKELNTTSTLEGRFTVTKLKTGKIPILKMDFDLGNKGFTGNLTGVIAPEPALQMNSDILRSN